MPTTKIIKNKTLLVSLALGLACLILNYYFPVPKNQFLPLLTKNAFFLLIIPLLYIKFVLHQNFRDFGWALGNQKKGVLWLLISLPITLFVFYLLLDFPKVKESYQLPEIVLYSFSGFLIYELLIVSFLVFFLEFFFRGFFLFTLTEKFSRTAVLLQGIVFTIYALINQDFFPLIILSFTSGLVAYKSRSVVFSYIHSLLSLIILDGYIIYNINR